MKKRIVVIVFCCSMSLVSQGDPSDNQISFEDVHTRQLDEVYARYREDGISETRLKAALEREYVRISNTNDGNTPDEVFDKQFRLLLLGAFFND